MCLVFILIIHDFEGKYSHFSDFQSGCQQYGDSLLALSVKTKDLLSIKKPWPSDSEQVRSPLFLALGTRSR